jgi:RNA polymerase sigma factor FliA
VSDIAPSFELVREDGELWSAFADGESGARDRLFMLYQGYAEKIARQEYYKLNRGDLDIGDLKQLALTGLLQSISSFDPGRGTPFIAFATARIRGSIVDGVSKSSEIREQLSWHARIRRERIRSLVRDRGDAARKDGSVTEDLDAFTNIVVGLALGFILDQQSAGATDVAPDIFAPAYESAAWRELTWRMKSELELLPAKEVLVLRKHYYEHLDFSEICAILQLSKGRVSQLHRQALQSLQKRLGQRGYFRLER